jgi:hypothetical protein
MLNAKLTVHRETAEKAAQKHSSRAFTIKKFCMPFQGVVIGAH